MQIIIKKLTPEMYEDYLYYFDNVGFSDHEDWSACYCLESHLGKHEPDYKTKEIRREKAKELIMKGIMNGYLIHTVDGQVIGWCNVDDKTQFVPIMENPYMRSDEDKPGEILVTYCFDIAPNYRGKGIASQAMAFICDEAKKAGFRYIEGYPFCDKAFAYQYHGPCKLYEKYGFQKLNESNGLCRMRKEIEFK